MLHLGNVFIADYQNLRIRKMTLSSGIITTIAGSGGTGTTSGTFSGDGGLATSAKFSTPMGVAVDSSGTRIIPFHSSFLIIFQKGNVFVADQRNNRIRKVTISTGIIATVVGSSTTTGFSGDGGAATAALLNYPIGSTIDSAGTHSMTKI